MESDALYLNVSIENPYFKIEGIKENGRTNNVDTSHPFNKVFLSKITILMISFMRYL